MNLPDPDWQTDDGSVKLWCADCMDILPKIEKESIDMIWTDPPYGHGNMNGDLQEARIRDAVKGARRKHAEPIANDVGEDFEMIIRSFLTESSRILRRDCCCCCCCCCGGGGPSPTFSKVSLWMDSVLSFFHAVVWDKSARGNGMGWRYRRNYEFVMVAHRKGGRLSWTDDSLAVPNIVKFAPVRDRIHPNEKPLEMIESFIEWHSSFHQTILDPFMGSGTTGVACIRLGRKFLGIEKERKYFDIAVNRIKDALGQEVKGKDGLIQRRMFAEDAK